MPQFTLYGARGSSNSDRIRLTLAEAGFTDYDYVLLNLLKGEQKHTLTSKSPEHLARHPWGKVPVVTFPDGLVLYESRAISKHLARSHAPHLLPRSDDPVSEALFDQAQSVETLYFAEPAGRIAFEKFAKRLLSLPTDEAAVDASLKALNQYFDVAEKLLHRNEYMAGPGLSLVDIFYIPLVQRLFLCGYGDELVLQRPAVCAWWQRVTARPGIAALLAADKEAAAAAMAAAQA